jgi:hypothetical protein
VNTVPAETTEMCASFPLEEEIHKPSPCLPTGKLRREVRVLFFQRFPAKIAGHLQK